MLLEQAEIDVKPGSEEALAEALRNGALAALADCEGVISLRFGRGVENPSKFIINVRWTSLEAHTAAASSENFQRFRQAVGPHVASGGMQHFEMEDELTGRSA